MGFQDWLWSFGGLAAVAVLTGSIVIILRGQLGITDWSPSFMALDPLTPGRYWILAAWLPFFVLNILGEELVWRGVVLPRQVAAFGTRAWLINGAGWLFVHVAFPWQVLLALLPTVFVVPYVVQRRGNTWTGVVIHAGLNGAGFLALAFGAL
jgi:membrane protease YdiL (CAAX protease family)